RQPRLPHPLVVASPAQAHQTLLLQGLDQPGDIAGIEPQAPAQVTQVRSLRADLVQEARLPQRAIAPKEMIIQSSGALGHHSIEAADLGSLIGQHSLTLVNYVWAVNASQTPGGCATAAAPVVTQR